MKIGGGSGEISDELLAARIADLARRAEKLGQPAFSDFLDQRQQKLAEQAAHRNGCARFICRGGFEGAERAMIGLFPSGTAEEESLFPITVLECSFRKEDRPGHRDFLGSLMSLGIKRSKLGDILVGDDRANLIVSSGISEYILSGLSSVGGAGVRVRPVPAVNLEVNNNFKEIYGTIPSPRIDAALSCLLKLSRSKCTALIQEGIVRLDYEVCESLSREIRAGQLISVRGYGRYRIDEVGSLTKKGRLRLCARKYE